MADKLISNDSSRLVNTTAGGTTTDVGVLVNGLPRPAAATVDIAGVRTNFALPDVLSTGSPDHHDKSVLSLPMKISTAVQFRYLHCRGLLDGKQWLLLARQAVATYQENVMQHGRK